MNDVTLAFANYLQTAGFGTYGTNIFVGYIPENTDAIWLEQVGGNQNNYVPMQEAVINIYIKNTNAATAVDTLNQVKNYIHRMHSTTVSNNYIYTMLVLGNIEDITRDLEYAKIFKLTVQLTYRNTNVIS